MRASSLCHATRATRLRFLHRKLAKYVPGRKSAAGDKSATRVDSVALALSSDVLPLAPTAFTNADEEGMQEQARTWIEMMANDAVAMAVDDAGDA